MAEPMARRRPGPRPAPVSSLVALYLRTEADAGHLAPATLPTRRAVLRSFFNATAKPAGEVTRHDVEAWVGRPGISAATRRQQLSMIRTFYGWLVEHGHVAADPTSGIRRVRVPRTVPRGLKPEQVRRLLEVCPDARARLVVLLEVQLGMRSVEVARLRVEHIDFTDRTVFVAEGKGGHQRLLPVPDEAWDALEAYLRQWPAGSGPLIRTYPQANQYAGAGVTSPTIVRLISRCMKAAGINEGGHALRHTFATDLVRRGVHLRDVQAALGHASLQNTARYLPTNVADLRDAMGGRRYSADAPEAPPVAAPAPAPALDAIGPLIDTVAALAAAVARLEARLDGQPGAAAPKAPEETVTCERCGRTGARKWMERFHLDSLHCPDCGKEISAGKYVWHRRRIHGFTGCAWSWNQPHEHTASGHCLCPLCHQSSATLVWGAETMVTHFERLHEPCPDCDGAYIKLGAHRRRHHPWSS